MPHSTTFPTEHRRVFAYILVLLALTCLPYLSGIVHQNADWQFSGFVFGIEDGYSYLGKMRLGAQGESAFRLFYTHEPHESAPLLFTPYLLAGWLISLVTPPNALATALLLAYHVMRLASGALLITVVDRFIGHFLRTSSTRMLALVLATAGGGMGGLAALFGLLLPDLYVPEGFSFLILYGLPHLALARAALLAGFLCVFTALKTTSGAWKSVTVAGLLWNVVGLCVPFYLAVIYAVLAAWGLACWLRDRRFPLRLFVIACGAAGLTLPLLAWFAWVFLSNPAFSEWSSQNILPTPAFWKVVLACLPLLIPAGFALRWAWNKAAFAEKYALLIAWVLIVPVLIVLPINVQRRLSEGVIIPLAILAAAGVRLGFQRSPLVIRRGITAIACSSAAFLLLGGLLVTLNPASPVFYSTADQAAFRWLAHNACPQDVVIAAPETALMLPAWANVRTYYGHPVETLDAARKQEAVLHWYSGAAALPDRAALIAESGARWVWFGTNEHALMPDTAPSWANELTLSYDVDSVQIYSVVDEVWRC